MGVEFPSASEENKSGVLDVQFDQVLAATDGARFLEARQIALEAGFFEEGSSPDKKLLAGRLAGQPIPNCPQLN